MASFNDGNPTDTDAQQTALETYSGQCWEMAGRIFGLSGDIKGAFDSSAMDFTKLISEDIKSTGDGNVELWMDSAWSLIYFASTMEEWAGYVSDFKVDRNKLITDWNSGVGTKVTPGSPALTARYPYYLNQSSSYSSGSKEVDFEEEMRESFNQEFRKIWNKLEDDADKISDRLAQGPTIGNVRELVEGGHLGWAPYNLQGSSQPLPLTPDQAEDDAKHLASYYEEGKEPDEEYWSIMMGLNAVAVQAAQWSNHEKGAKRVGSDSMQYLEDFYAELEEIAHSGFDKSTLQEFLSDGMAGMGLSGDDYKFAAGALGDGLLVLSNESFGGDLSRLPTDIQDLSSDKISGESAGYLIDLFGNTTSGLEAGRDFSVNLTLSIGHFLDDYVGDVPDGMDNVVGMSTLNVSANEKILAGEAEFNLSDGSTRDGGIPSAIRGLFTHEWEDGGEAAGQLISWIPEYAENGTPAAEKRAGDAAANFMELIAEDDKMFESLKDNDVQVDGDEKPAFTIYNEMIADPMFRIFAAYAEDFGNAAVDDGYGYNAVSEGAAEENPLLDEGDYTLDIPMEARERYLELLTANEDVAPFVVDVANKTSQSYTNEYVDYMMNEDADAAPDVWAQPSGRLHRTVDQALLASYEDKLGDDKKAAEETLKTRERGLKLGTSVVDVFATPADAVGGFAYNTVKGYAQEGAINLATEDLKKEIKEIDKEVKSLDMRTEGEIYQDNRLVMGNALIENGYELPDSITKMSGKGHLIPAKEIDDSNLRDPYEGKIQKWLVEMNPEGALRMDERLEKYHTAFYREYSGDQGSIKTPGEILRDLEADSDGDGDDSDGEGD